MKKWQVINGNNIDILKTYEDNTFDSIVTDPPYGIAFLGKDWDNDTGAMETWEECFRVLKPGGHILAFSAARTYHHLATNIEMAGFEIRDQLIWLYGSGFPKAQDIGKAIQKRMGVKETRKLTEQELGGTRQMTALEGLGENHGIGRGYETICTDPEAQQWSGWKTALKPAHEPILMARKPFKGSAVDNVLEHGTGALNIDASRVKVADDELKSFQKEWDRESRGKMEYLKLDGKDPDYVAGSVRDYVPEGRFPSNVIMDEEAGAILDKQTPHTKSSKRTAKHNNTTKHTNTYTPAKSMYGEHNTYGDEGGVSRFFYCPKVSRAERHIGFSVKTNNTRPRGEAFGDSNLLNENKVGNNHPTVKPVELMKYLVRLITPPNGVVLDPFNGSGSTGMACVELDYEYVGCELDPEYVEIANNRISAWEKKFDTPANNLFD